ncbi:MAG: GntR family transcriptional regulator [Roseibium sp.]|uniref:GntR family transcriptional regulator n=1 Tax=Roseibium sp. TaxID=1936156 RepID=UPI002610EFB6|nr:GntR family transcriptional regulator [Roseibium sp.]MCV0426228.1 GntR family transcriptional regulator [Roseibium sp.]
MNKLDLVKKPEKVKKGIIPGFDVEGSDRDLIYRMKRDILAGTFKRGDWLRLKELEQRYSVSRAEVRKALAALELLRLLEHVEHYGYRVFEFDDEEEQDVQEIRFILEIAAIEKVMARATPEDIKILRDLAEKFEWCIENATMSETDLANHKFHRGMVGICGNANLVQLINNLRELFQVGGGTPWETYAGMRKSAEHHTKMIDFIEAKDIDGFKVVLKEHMTRWMRDAAKKDTGTSD